jgi:ribosome recycling factor
MLKEIEKISREKMDHALESLAQEFATLRTGRASVALVDGLEVSAYGQPMPLKQMATISTPDARSIVIQPWDAKQIPAIEKAIMAANLGFTPMNDGRVIRINVPAPTEERRKELVKMAHGMAEQARVAMRNVRRHSNDELKKTEKNHQISEDECHLGMENIQRVTDAEIKKIDETLAKKEKEIMEV